MTRNTLRRVEVAPGLRPGPEKPAAAHFDTIMLDDEKGKEQQADGSYTDRPYQSHPSTPRRFFYEEAYEASKS